MVRYLFALIGSDFDAGSMIALWKVQGDVANRYVNARTDCISCTQTMIVYLHRDTFGVAKKFVR